MVRSALNALGIAVSLLVASAAYAGQLEAKKGSVDVFAEASKKSTVIASLKQGQTIESLERKGMYWEVKTADGKTGFVSVFDVKKAESEPSTFSKAIRDATQEGRDTDSVADSRSRSAVMGVRGLGEDDDTAFAGEARPNLRAVYAMEDIVVSEKDLEKQGELVFAEIEKYAD